MKVSARQVSALLERPGPKLRAALMYGPDQGLVRERADRMARAIVEDLTDPFRVSDLSAANIKDNPARLLDEAAALSMTNGARIVRVRGANEKQVSLFTALFETKQSLSLVIAEAGELRPRSPLRILFEECDHAVAIGCYLDDTSGIDDLIRDLCQTHNLTITPDARRYLVDNLGSDRLVSRSELDKLVLYLGQSRQVTESDVSAVVGDNGAATMHGFAVAVADGDHCQVTRALARLSLQGVTSVQALRGALHHLHRLHLIAIRVASGESVARAVNSLRPPVHFTARSAVQRQALAWSDIKLRRAMSTLLDAEIDCKSRGNLSTVIANMAFLRVANAAQRLKTRGLTH